jgi:hypothetical protein
VNIAPSVSQQLLLHRFHLASVCFFQIPVKEVTASIP